jgi:hypothetical protein
MIKYTTIRKDDVMMRVDRAIELMIEDLEEELKNVSK